MMGFCNWFDLFWLYKNCFGIISAGWIASGYMDAEENEDEDEESPVVHRSRN